MAPGQAVGPQEPERRDQAEGSAQCRVAGAIVGLQDDVSSTLRGGNVSAPDAVYEGAGGSRADGNGVGESNRVAQIDQRPLAGAIDAGRKQVAIRPVEVLPNSAVGKGGWPRGRRVITVDACRDMSTNPIRRAGCKHDGRRSEESRV